MASMENLFDSIDDGDEPLEKEEEAHIENQITRFEEEEYNFNDRYLDKTISHSHLNN